MASNRSLSWGRKAVTIGRGAEADMLIADKLASRIHCGISYKDGNYFSP